MSELKEKRKKLGLTQIQAANACGVSRRTYQTYEETNNINNTYNELYKILDEMGLFDGSNWITNPKFIKRVCTEVISNKYPGVSCVYLFGSYSRGEATGKSDIDLLVVYSSNETNLKALKKDLEEKIHKNVDIFSSSQLLNNESLLIKVLNDGMKIYDNSKAKNSLQRRLNEIEEEQKRGAKYYSLDELDASLNSIISKEHTKIIVVGPSGAGKSYFSKKLAKITGLPLYHLDNIFWKEDKTHISREEFDDKLLKILEQDKWIIDGDYSRTYELRIKYADTIYFLDFPLKVALDGVEQRIGKPRDDIPWKEEIFDPEFKEWIIDWYKKTEPCLYHLIDKYKGTKNIVIFKTREEVDSYIESCRSASL